MRQTSIALILLTLLTVSCEEEEIPVSPLPSIYHGMVLQSRLEHQLGENSWSPFNYVTIYIGSAGEYCTVNEGNDNSFEGHINWHTEDGLQKFDITADDRSSERSFKVNRYDGNHMLAEIDWGDERQEWLFTVGTGALTGVVIDEINRSPVQGALIIVKEQQGIIGQLYSDPYGYFGVNTQTQGFAGLNNASKIEVYIQEKSDAEQEVSVSSGECTFYLVEMTDGSSGLNYGTVSGNVQNETGAFLEGATITYGDGSSYTVTGSNGEYELLVPVGYHALTASLDGYEDASQSVNIESLNEYDVNFTLELSGYNLGGSVTSAGGVAISGATLTFEDQYGNTITTTASGDDGTFNIENVEDGIYILSISASGWNIVPDNYPVAVEGGDIANIHFLALEEGKTGIGGRVTHWDDDSPLTDVKISATGNNTYSNADGYYIMELQRPGSIMVSAEKEDFLNRYKERNISDAELDYFNFKMTPPSSAISFTIESEVWDSSTGNPVAGATVDVVNNSQAITNLNGECTVNIDIYDEGLAQWVEIITSKTGYKSDTIYVSIVKEVPCLHQVALIHE